MPLINFKTYDMIVKMLTAQMLLFGFLIGILSCKNCLASIKKVNSDPIQIRVRILEKLPSLNINGVDLKLYKPHSRHPKDFELLAQTGEWTLKCENEKIQLLRLSSSPPTRLRADQPIRIQSPTGFVWINHQLYRGEIEVRSIKNQCEAINHLELEKYLSGLVNSEFSSQWNGEAIAAQVIAARSYAYYQKTQAAKLENYFDLDSTIKDQVYQGPTREDFRSTQIVTKTQGLVLVPIHSSSSQEFTPLKAFYHSTCGGETELPEKVWGNALTGFKKRIKCPFCKESPAYEWKLKIKSSEITEAIRRGVLSSSRPKEWPKEWNEDFFQPNNLIEIRTISGSSNQRVDQVLTIWRNKSKKIALPINGPKFREWIGFTRLKSTRFQVQHETGIFKNDWIFRGRGNGHGVGMCQWGVKTMGEKGYPYASILRYYYPDAFLKKLW